VSSFDPLWQTLARQLGETRNWDVFVGDTLPAIAAAFPACGEVDRLSHYARRRCTINRQAARSALKSVDYSRLLLEFTAAVLALPVEGEARRVDAFAPRCLDKRAKQVRRWRTRPCRATPRLATACASPTSACATRSSSSRRCSPASCSATTTWRQAACRNCSGD
jgi:CHAD domain-containing protein